MTNKKITIMTSSNSYLNYFRNLLYEKFIQYDFNIVNKTTEVPNGDVAFYLSCYELVKEDVLSKNKHNIVIHESDLPRGKGWSPASWQILEGKNTIPLTLFEMNNKVDAGDVYFKDFVTLNGYELKDEWQKKIVEKKIEMCLLFLEKYINTKPIKQSGQETFYPRRTKNDCELDINKTLKEQFNLLRIVDNVSYPAFFSINNIKYKIEIKKCRVE